MICQACGVEATTRYVSFHQNIGVLVVRFSKSIEGRLCKSCIHKHFWSLTGTTFVLGWWGTISFIITPFLLLNNVVRYALCLGMPPVAPGAQPPELTEDAVARISPHARQLFASLNDGESLETLAGTVATLAGVTPAQVILFVQAVARAQQQN
jgi:hypothetical protein